MQNIIVVATATLVCASAFAHGPERSVRYRVEEVPPPASLLAPCLPEYRNFIQGSANDFGIAGGNFNCYTQVDPETGTSTTVGGPFVWASWFGSLALRDSDGINNGSFAASINNRSEVFGSDVGATFVGVKWSLAGGLETIFPNDPLCEFITLDIAIAGNGRYSVGIGYRPGPDLPIPGFCLTPTWLTRTPSGTVVQDLSNASPVDINLFNTGVGVWEGNTAIRLNVVTKELRVLRTGDETHQARTTDINDLGEVSGYVATVNPVVEAGGCFSLSARALRWDRNDRETLLPLLPGATSSRAWNVGTDGETVGESGPGQYCEPQNSTNERAVLWRDGKAFDLNHSISSHQGVTLASAYSINRRGQILAFGYRNDDPLVICPRFVFDPETGRQSLDVSQRCRSQRLFMLTPVGR